MVISLAAPSALARGLLLALAVLWLAGCGDSPQTPEAAIRALIDSAAAGVESGDIDPLEQAVAADFESADGQDREAVLRLVRLYMLRYPSMHLVVRVELVDVVTADYATAQVLVGSAARPLDSPQALTAYRAAVHRVDLSWQRSGERWRVYQADWERTAPGALIRLW